MNLMLKNRPAMLAVMLSLSTLAPATVFADTAEAQTEPYKMDAATLGRLDAILGLCAKSDVKHRAVYERACWTTAPR